MTTLQFARREARARAGGHPFRFAVGAVLTGCGAALFLSDVARWIAGAL